jgi:hypothetical protein
LLQAISGSLGGKSIDMSEFFPSLKIVFNQKSKIEELDRIMPKGVLLAFMKNAKNGDDSGWDFDKLLEENKLGSKS